MLELLLEVLLGELSELSPPKVGPLLDDGRVLSAVAAVDVVLLHHPAEPVPHVGFAPRSRI